MSNRYALAGFWDIGLGGRMPIVGFAITRARRDVAYRRSAASSPDRFFAVNLSRTFYDFEPDFFQQNVSRLVDDEVGLIRSALEIWPTLLEIVYFQKLPPIADASIKKSGSRDVSRSEGGCLSNVRNNCPLGPPRGLDRCGPPVSSRRTSSTDSSE